jgi:CSLREA domain-containing protein
VPVNGAGKLLGFRVLAAAAIALACALAGPSPATAEQFSVNTTTDESDAAVGNEFCETATGRCSLRAAIEEGNELSGDDEIRFDEEVFVGDADSVIEPEPALPAIVSTIGVAGGSCQTGAGVSGPCVEIAGDPAAVGLRVAGAGDVLIERVAVTGSEVGIELLAAERFFVKGNWLGTSLDGTATGNETAIRVASGSNDSRVGGEGEGTGNLIANSSLVGLEIRGASKVRVIGNRFGVTPSEDEAAANNSNIVIGSTTNSVALENTIGTRISQAAASTPACDGGCNLIAGSEGSGIDLDAGGDLAAAVATTVAGNLIGFDASGAGTIPNAGAGIDVGGAPRTVIGGPKPADANRFTGGTAAVEAGPGAPGLTIRGNLIGTKAVTAPPPTDGGILVDSTSLRFPAEEASVLENEIGLDGGVGISQGGFAATISDNAVEGGETGIWLHDEAGESLIRSNAIRRTQGAGILVESSLNEIVGNTVVDAGEAGIHLLGAAPFGIGANAVGGETPAAENTIDSSAGPAIAIESTEESRNEVARNRGSGNGGAFVDLIPLDGSGDPNEGIQPPAITTVSAVGAAGFAEPGATVRVFRKTSTLSGEIESFLGLTTADGAGTWSLPFPTELPPGMAIGAAQTLSGGSSEFEITTVPSPDVAGAGQKGGGSVDRKRPRTRMLKQPRKVRAGRSATFSFTSNEAGSSFQCSLDRARFRPCKSPKSYRVSKPGKHLFRVRAIDPAGNFDRTPVRRRFEVIG